MDSIKSIFIRGSVGGDMSAMGGVCGVGPVSRLWFWEGGFGVTSWEEGLGAITWFGPKATLGSSRVVPSLSSNRTPLSNPVL